jgi:acyl-CoA reductase-like NAD-dependent aldehyde dehydrogenase
LIEIRQIHYLKAQQTVFCRGKLLPQLELNRPYGGKRINPSLYTVYVVSFYCVHTRQIHLFINTDARISYVSFCPLGVILAIMPRNFPFWQVFRFAANELEAGSCFVNAFVKSDPRLPFGGIKQSELGTPQGWNLIITIFYETG